MTHDPLCEVLEDAGFMVAYFGPAGSSDDMGCLSCELIAKVRADERNGIIGVMERNADADKTRTMRDGEWVNPNN